MAPLERHGRFPDLPTPVDRDLLLPQRYRTLAAAAIVARAIHNPLGRSRWGYSTSKTC
jgi:hypothetical protein